MISCACITSVEFGSAVRSEVDKTQQTEMDEEIDSTYSLFDRGLM